MITGIEISKVEAGRELNGAITNMKFNINFDNVKVNQESVNVTFTFVATYEGSAQSKTTKVGELKITGDVISKENKKDAEEIESTWKNKKTLPIKFAEDVINILNFECGARGTLVAYSIGFAAPIPISRAKLQETQGGAG
jgi:hypothetical protein